jgi:integral membrane protein (TIGR01906 family)
LPVEPSVLASTPAPKSAKVAGPQSTRDRVLAAVAVAVCVVVLPVVIVLVAVRFAFSWQPVYNYAVSAYHPETTTGIPAPQLERATHVIRDYFSNAQRDLDVTVVDTTGNRVPLFNDREIAHMRDVKALVLRLYRVLDIALAALLIAASSMLIWPLGGLRRLAAALLAGSAVTGALLIGFAAVAAFGGFDQLFLDFHLLSFSNDFWLLDPTRDHLVQLFPQGYWLDVTIFVVALSLTISAAIAVSATTYLLATRGGQVSKG